LQDSNQVDTIYRQWKLFVSQMESRSGLASEAVPFLILASWERSRMAGVHPEHPAFHRLPGSELRQRLRRNRALLAAAIPRVMRLSEELAGLRHVLYLTDAEGVVLFTTPVDEAHEARLLPGYDWSERRMGTNGAGTALATGRSVAVLGCEHFCAAWHRFGCLAAPVFVNGRAVAALDLSAPVELIHPLQLGIVARTAYEIERELLPLHSFH
jgi:transcriptional regulator of acetoin/glycerol metabolism